MVPPPATPNPHRFSTSKHGQIQPSSRPHQLPTPQTQSSQQFASTPRFAFVTPLQTPSSTSNAQKPSQFSSPLLSRRPTGTQSRYPAAARSDDIEEPSSDSDDDAAQPTHATTQSRSTTQRPHAEIIEDPPSPPQTSPCHKRRRIQAETISISSSSSPSPPPQPPISTPPPPPSSPDLQDPTTSCTTHHTTRFILSPKASRHAPTSPHLPTRPPFTLPPRSPSPPPASLLMHPLFSPHRKGGPKFVSGGLAGCVRDWVVDLATSAAGSTRKRDGEDGGWDKRVLVGEVRAGERVVLVEEEGRDAEAWRWMLVGQGQGVVRKGDVIGVKGPMWEVEIKGERWNVGVDWGVVDE